MRRLIEGWAKNAGKIFDLKVAHAARVPLKCSFYFLKCSFNTQLQSLEYCKSWVTDSFEQWHCKGHVCWKKNVERGVNFGHHHNPHLQPNYVHTRTNASPIDHHPRDIPSPCGYKPDISCAHPESYTASLRTPLLTSYTTAERAPSFWGYDCVFCNKLPRLEHQRCEYFFPRRGIFFNSKTVNRIVFTWCPS